MGSKVKVAVIDLYNCEENEGIRCLKEIINEAGTFYSGVPVEYQQFETRLNGEIADSDFDIYISPGGPGRPSDGQRSDLERKYFRLLDSILSNNNKNTVLKNIFSLSAIHSRLWRAISILRR